jgi:hypothetical protein
MALEPRDRSPLVYAVAGDSGDRSGHLILPFTAGSSRKQTQLRQAQQPIDSNSNQYGVYTSYTLWGCRLSDNQLHYLVFWQTHSYNGLFWLCVYISPSLRCVCRYPSPQVYSYLVLLLQVSHCHQRPAFLVQLSFVLYWVLNLMESGLLKPSVPASFTT